MNLIGNAVKFTSRGTIVVRADVEAGDAQSATVHFRVSDTGIGMDSATIARIFQPFTQADESTSRRFGGSGLGLAICRELAGLMRGSISVESQPQVGSTFRLTLPLKVGVEQPVAGAGASAFATCMDHDSEAGTCGISGAPHVSFRPGP